MKKTLVKILVTLQLISLVNPSLFVHAGSFSITKHAGDTSTGIGTTSFVNGGTFVRPGQYLRILSEANNGTSDILTNVQMHFSNAALDDAYSGTGPIVNVPNKFYNYTNGYSLGNNGSGFNPPSQSYGTFPQSLVANDTASAYRYGIYILPTYSKPIFSPSVYFTADGGITSGTSTYSVKVDVRPHIRSVAFSSSAIPNDNSASTTLTVTVRDWNGCSNITPGNATVTADLHALGNGYSATEPLAYISCDTTSKIATFEKTGIKADSSATILANTITATAKDNDNNFGGPSADTFFWNANGNEGDTNTQTLTVNSSTGPIPAVDSLPSPATLGTSGSSVIGWHSDKTGTYEVRVGATSCVNGTIVSTGTVSATTPNSIASTIQASSLVNGVNTIYLCAKDQVGNIGLVTTSITKDTTPPVSGITSYGPTTLSSENVSVTWNASEAGTYIVEVNGSSLSSGDGINVTGSYVSGDVISVINNSVFQNGSNTIRIKMTDTAGNGPVYSTNSATVTKDNTPPPPVQSVSLIDCDTIGNNSTPCALYGNPKNGVTGRDFYVNFTLPTATGGIQEYDVYAVQSGQVLTSTSTILARIYGNDITGTSTGVWLSDSLVSDSNGHSFISSGTGAYSAIIKAFKANGLYSSEVTSTGTTISFDNIVLPAFSLAKFTSNTGITLTYSKTLTGSLIKFDSSRMSSSDGCFTFDTSSGTGALFVSGSTVTFSIQPLGNIAKTCNDLTIGTGAVTDFEGLYNEEKFSGQIVSDGQIPSPITITAPTNNKFVGGSGAFTFAYNFPENMTAGSIILRFMDNSGAIINYPISTFSSSGSHSLTLTGSTIGLVDAKTYSLELLANDVAGNAGSSSLVAGMVYDITNPSSVTHISPVDLSHLNTSTPVLTWAGATDNYSSTSNLRYTIEISLALDFSSILETSSNVSGTGFTLSALTSNTGYYWRVKAIDEAGNVGAFGTISSFIFDNTPPVISTLGSDTYIKNTTKSFTGFVKNSDTAEVYAKITDNFNDNILPSDISANLSAIGGGASVSPISYNTGTKLATWAGVTTNCSDGVKDIPITANDRAGNTGNYTLTVVCDNTAPAVTNATITNPAVGAYLSGGITTNVTWNTSFYTSELSPISNPVSVAYSTNSGSSWTSLVTLGSNDGSVSWSIPSIDTANALVRLVATDKLGNTATGMTSFVIDSTDPSVSGASILSPNGGEFLKGSTGTGINITWNPAVIIDTNIANNPISLDYSTNSGSTWLSIATGLSNNGSHVWTVPASAYDSPNVRIRLVAHDKVAHTASDTSDVNFTIDSTLPTITVDSPSTPPTTSYINNSGFDISAIGADTNIDKAYYSFSYGGDKYWNESGSGSWLGVQNWNMLCNTPATCSAINTTVLPGPIVDGTVYTLVLRSIDKAGNLKDSSSFVYTGDMVAPSITNLVQSGSYFSGAVNISGIGSDARSGIASLTLQIQRKGDNWYYNGTDFVNTGAISLLTTTSNSYANWNYTGFNVPAGDADGTQYIVTATAIDRAYKINNTTSSSFTIAKDANGPTITAPLWTNPTGGEIWNGGASKTLTWNPAQITDSVSGLNSASGIIIEYSTEGGSFVTIADNVANSGSYNWTLPYPLDSSITLRLSARDRTGNLGAGNVSKSFIIDSVPPTIAGVETVGDTLGKVAGVIVRFSENINTTGVNTSHFSYSPTIPLSASYITIDSKTIQLLFVTATGTTNFVGTLAYAGNSIYDVAGNLLAGTSKSVVDKASPIITNTTLFDSNGNGKIDQIKAYFSESLVSTTDTSAWTLNNPLPGMSTSPSFVSVAGNVATLTLSEPTSFSTSSGGMTVSFISNSNWKDISTSANVASSLTNSPLIDSATPIITGMQTFDNSGNYAIDATFSEPVVGTLSGFTLSGSSTFTGNIIPASSNVLRFTTLDLTSDSTKMYSLSYSGSGLYLRDSSNNYLANFSNRSVIDAIAPKIISKNTLDINGNGKIDAVRLGFSEPLAGTSSGATVSVAGYVVTGYLISGTGLTATLTEGVNPDTGATPLVQLQNNTTISDTIGNIIASEGVGTPATDAVGPVVTGVRFDGDKTLYVNISESVSGALNIASFVLSGATASITSVNFPSGSNSGTITLNNNGIISGTSELSFAQNSVGDTLGNKQSQKLFTKVSATVIINEVMWSGTGAGATQYIELHNLGTSDIDISGWKIENAASNGTGTLILPASQIAGNGYYLITSTAVNNTSNLLFDSLPVQFAGSLSLNPDQTGNIILKNASDVVYDQVKPWLAGNADGPASMERKSSIGDGLSSASWYTAQTGTGFDTVGPFGTPGIANVFDAKPPTITSFSPTDNILYPMGNVTITYNYSDSGGMAIKPAYAFLLEKNNGGGYTNVTDAALSSSGINASSANFVTKTLEYGQYLATFTVSDSAGNVTQQVSNFYVDAPSMTISTGSYSIGKLSSADTVFGTETMIVTIQTLGAGFNLSLAGSGTLDAGLSQIGTWNGTTGYGMDYQAMGSGTTKSYGGNVTAIPGAVLENFATGSYIGGNGNLHTFTYIIRYGAKIPSLQTAGNYTSVVPIKLSLQY